VNAQLPLAATRQLDLSFARRGDRTVFERRLFSWPFVLTRTFRLDTAVPHLQTVIVQTSGGAIHGEDRLLQRLHLGPGAAVHLTTQGATAVHRANPGLTTRETVAIDLEPGAWLEYLPQPRILFPDAAMRQSIDIDCDPVATAIIGDAFTLHDPEQRGRLFRRMESTLTVRRGGEPVLIDRFDITGDPRHFARHTAFGTLLLLAPRPAEVLEAWALDLSAALAGHDGLYAAGTVLPSAIGLGLRFGATELRNLRSGTELAYAMLRQRLLATEPNR
jgi:urease accessory protein